MSSTNEAETGGDFLLYEKDVENRIAYLTFNRPKVLNGPTVAMRQQYAELLWEANVDNDVKVLVIRGAGENLGSGADLEEHFKNWANDPLEDWGVAGRENVTAPPVGSYRAFVGPLYATRTAGCRSLQEFRKVSIVEVKGYCYGWHFYQAGDADIVVASDDALFGHSAFRYVGWGPRMWTWIETIGLRKFQEMVFTGRPFTAQEMAECNFVNSLVPRATSLRTKPGSTRWLARATRRPTGS